MTLFFSSSSTLLSAVGCINVLQIFAEFVYFSLGKVWGLTRTLDENQGHHR